MKRTTRMHLLSVFIIFLAGPSAVAASAIIDRGSYTTFTKLGIDVYDIYTFENLTHQETLDAIEALQGDWRLARMDDVRPIYQALTEKFYLESLRHMLGYSSKSPDGLPVYITGGRVADIFPDSYYPDFNYVWGFGNGVLTWDEAGIPMYVWSSFGMGMDIADLRFTEWGAWAIRSTPVPEPGTLALLGMGLVGMGMRRRIKAS